MARDGKRLLATLGWCLLAASGVALSRPQAVRLHEETSSFDHVFALPDPDHLVVMSLGYRSALADLLFGQTLVTSGVHFREKKVFEHLDGYLRAIVHLEPTFRDVYFYADSLLTLSSVEMPKRNYRIARDLQTEGLPLFPEDAELWMSVGQFVSYLAPQHMPEAEDADEWRAAGAEIMQHACDLWPSDRAVPLGCLGSVTLLTRAGETEAAIRSLERLIAVSDDPQTRAQATSKLEALLNEQQKDLYRSRIGELAKLRARDLPVATRGTYQLMVPPADLPGCVGLREIPGSRRCASSFALYGDAIDRGARF